MPTIEQNINQWEKKYDWKQLGEEWSSAWGNTNFMWYGSILPRIIKYLKPNSTILEIAPGCGRITFYLKDLCKELIVTDISKRCIDKCRDRFKNNKNIKYFVTDGKSLPFIPDNSIDFVFSWDSFVHMDNDAVGAYIKEFGRIMKPSADGFVHHTNYLDYKGDKNKVISWRGQMSAKLFLDQLKQNKINCISQEIVTWDNYELLDCFSVFTKRPLKEETVKIINDNFMKEALFFRK